MYAYGVYYIVSWISVDCNSTFALYADELNLVMSLLKVVLRRVLIAIYIP